MIAGAVTYDCNGTFTSISATDMTHRCLLTIGSFGIDQVLCAMAPTYTQNPFFTALNGLKVTGLLAGTMCFITKSH
jgi:hypothetical protein